VDVTSTISYKVIDDNKSAVDINLLVDPGKLTVENTPDGKFKLSYDLVGFVYDQYGKMRGGFSQTVNTNLNDTEYARAKTEGLNYDQHTALPSGYYQLRIVVRDSASGNMGTLTRYLEIPNLAKHRLAMSSLFLYGVDQAAGAKTEPETMNAARRISKSRDLRYATVVYNAKQPSAKIVISQNGKMLFQEPEQPLSGPMSGVQVGKVGQVGLSKVTPGHYVLTLVTTDQLAEKKQRRTVSRSVDFTVVN